MSFPNNNSIFVNPENKSVGCRLGVYSFVGYSVLVFWFTRAMQAWQQVTYFDD